MKRYIWAAAAVIMLFSLCACARGGGQAESPAAEADKVVISFDFQEQSGYASNQFAVWIEDMNGNHVKTLYATHFTANGGYKERPDSIPVWVERSGLAAMSKAEADAITGATPKSGTLSYTWDLTDKNGVAVAAGKYNYFVEGSLRWKNRVMYSGVIETGSSAADAEAEAEYFYEGAGDQPALTDGSPENSMIGAVKARFVPAAG